jgi:hypothetical protein
MVEILEKPVETTLLSAIFQKCDFLKKIFFAFCGGSKYQKNHRRTFFDKIQNGGIKQDGGFQ